MMMKKSAVWLIIFLIVLSLFSSFMLRQQPKTYASVTDYYVSVNSGSDSNDGSLTHPWKTLPHAISTFSLGSSGTTIHVQSGSYPNANASCTEGGVAVCINHGGTSSQRLRLQCDGPSFGTNLTDPYAAQGQCKITGGSYGILAQASYIDVVGFDVGNTSGMVTALMAVYCGTIPNLSTCSNSVHFISNYVHDLGSGCPGAGAIEFSQTHGGKLADPEAIGNLVVRYGDDPGSSSCNLTHGIYANSGNAKVLNNIIVRVPTFGISYYSSACFGTVSNNVVIRAKGGLVFGTDGIGTSCANEGSNTISNNYFANILTKGNIDNAGTDCTASMPNFLGSNMSDGSAPNGDFPGTQSCDIKSPSSMTHVAGSSMFKNYTTDGTGDYSLKAGSPGIGAGSSGCSTGSGALNPCLNPTDLFGNTLGNPPPVGAITSGGSGPPPPPSGLLTPTSITFTDTLSGTTSPFQPITVKNTSAVAVVFSSIVASTNFGLVTSPSPCPIGGGGLAVGAQCEVDATFSPPSSGPFSGTVTFTDNFTGTPSSPQTVALNGNGFTPTAPATPTGLTVTVR